MAISRVCVFCGSSLGDVRSQAVTHELGQRLGEKGIDLIFGGGKIGLMGILAEAALARGGRVIGVIPQFLIEWEVAHTGLTELIVVDSMHDRKATMATLSDAFVALPGGFGTLEEFFEALTWLQLSLHSKPCILLNDGGFFTPLLNFLDSALEKGFISESSMKLITICTTIDELMDTLHGSNSSSASFQQELT